jgi:transposase
MSKYSLEFKLEVIQHYQLGTEGQKATAKRFGIDAGAVRKWAAAHQLHGIAGLTTRPGRYSAEFKESVIRHRQQHHLSVRETAAHFNIPAFTSIRTWEQAYNAGGINALSKNKRKQSKVMLKPPKSQPPQQPIDEMSKEELLTELQYLRMENDYLKKLEALIQQQKLSAPKPQRK